MANFNKIYIGADHAGWELQDLIINAFAQDLSIEKIAVIEEHLRHYPAYAKELAAKLAKDPNAMGILICGSGIGMSIMANRYQNIRAALCHNIEYSALSRQHNNANVLVLGSRFIQSNEAIDMVKAFLTNEFSTEERHQTRVSMLEDI